MENKIYMLNEATQGENSLTQGYVYTVPQADKERLISEGKAVEVNFPRVDALELSVQRAVNEFREAEKRIKTSPRYNDMESEREYQLEQLELKLDSDIKALENEFKLELEATQKELAQQAVANTFKPSETVNNFIDTELVQLGFSEDVEGDLELFAVKVNAMSDEDKATVLHNYGKIKKAVTEVAGDKADGTLKEIYNAVKGSNGATEINLKLKQLKALKVYNVATPYRMMKLKRPKVRGEFI